MKKHLKIYINAPITLSFVLICLIATVLAYVTNDFTTELLFSTYSSSLLNPLTYIRLVTHIFGHADFSHLLNNMIYILLLGPILEEKYHNKLIPIIITVAVITGVIHNIFSNGMLLGASGIVFAFILLASITGKEEGIPITLILVGLFYIGSEVIDAFFIQDNVSQMAHIIGGFGGACFGLFFKNEK